MRVASRVVLPSLTRRAMYSRVAGSCWRRCRTMVCSARLSWRQPPRLLTELLGCRHDHAAQLDERDATNVDGAPPREQQDAQRLLVLPGAWQRQRLCRKPSTCGADCVKRVVLAAQSPLAPGVAADLEHRLAALGEVASQTGAVMAGAFNRPDTSAVRMPL